MLARRIHNSRSACDASYVRAIMQDKKLPRPKLLKLANESAAALAKIHPCVKLDSQISDETLTNMLSDIGHFEEYNFVMLAGPLGVSDYEALTQRPFPLLDECTPQEKRAFGLLGDWIVRSALPPEFYVQKQCLLEWIKEMREVEDISKLDQDYQPLVQEIQELGMPLKDWRGVLNKLCPAALLRYSEEKFIYHRPSTAEMIMACRIRFNRLREAIEYNLYDQYVGTANRRFEVAKQISEYHSLMVGCSDPQTYVNIERKWQTQLASGGNPDIFVGICHVCRSFNRTWHFITKTHERPELQDLFPKQITGSPGHWWETLANINNQLVARLVWLLSDRNEQNKKDVLSVFGIMEDITLANIQAVDNALEIYRQSNRRLTRYKGAVRLFTSAMKRAAKLIEFEKVVKN